MNFQPHVPSLPLTSRRRLFFVPVSKPGSTDMARPVVGEADPAIVALEEQLRAAPLGADVAAVDRLIADELLFTGPDGHLGTKSQDLDSHRSGAVRLLAHEPEELRVRRVSDDVYVAALRARLDVRVGGSIVTGTYCYTRVCACGRKNEADRGVSSPGI